MFYYYTRKFCRYPSLFFFFFNYYNKSIFLFFFYFFFVQLKQSITTSTTPYTFIYNILLICIISTREFIDPSNVFFGDQKCSNRIIIISLNCNFLFFFLLLLRWQGLMTTHKRVHTFIFRDFSAYVQPAFFVIFFFLIFFFFLS